MNRIVLMVLRNLTRIPGAWIKLCRYAKNPAAYPEIEAWRHIQYILDRAITTGNIDLEVTGLENIPQEGSFVMFANHQGMFDVLAIAKTCDISLGTVFKKELYNVPFLHQVALTTRSYAMDREDVRQSLTVIQGVTEDLKQGRKFVIFPEGTRSRTGNQMLPFHGGTFRCATKSKTSVVPVALVDSYKVLDTKGSAPVKVQLHYLQPIPYAEYASLKPAELANLVQSRIQEKIDACT